MREAASGGPGAYTRAQLLLAGALSPGARWRLWTVPLFAYPPAPQRAQTLSLKVKLKVNIQSYRFLGLSPFVHSINMHALSRNIKVFLGQQNFPL